MTTSRTTLAGLVRPIDERGPSKDATVFSVSEKFGVIPQTELYNKEIATADRSKYRPIRYGDVVYNPYLLWNGAVGVCFDANGGCVSPAYIVLRPLQTGTEKFLHYFFRSRTLTSAVDAVAVGSVTRRRVAPLKDVLNLAFELPDLPSQRGASELLSAIDRKIELNDQLSKTLEALALALFRSWFVDFEPVLTKSHGKQLNFGALSDCSPNGFSATEGRTKPDGWVRTTVGDVAYVRSGGTPSKTDPSLWNGDIPWISPKAMTTIHVDNSEDHVTELAIGNGTQMAPRGTTFVMVRGMGLHSEVRVSQAQRDMAFNQDVKALVPHTVDPTILFFCLLNARGELLRKVETAGHGTGRLPSEAVIGYELTIPPAHQVAALAAPFERINTRIAAALTETASLIALRSVLIPRLISGELAADAVHRTADLLV